MTERTPELKTVPVKWSSRQNDPQSIQPDGRPRKVYDSIKKPRVYTPNFLDTSPSKDYGRGLGRTTVPESSECQSTCLVYTPFV